MSAPGSGGDAHVPVHRARLFPLPYLDSPCPPPGLSALQRRRFSKRRTIAAVTNHCILALNRLYSSPSFSSFSSVSPDNQHQPRCAAPSAAQHRLLDHVRQQCEAFVATAYIEGAPNSGVAFGRDIAQRITAASRQACWWAPVGDEPAPPKHTVSGEQQNPRRARCSPLPLSAGQHASHVAAGILL